MFSRIRAARHTYREAFAERVARFYFAEALLPAAEADEAVYSRAAYGFPPLHYALA